MKIQIEKHINSPQWNLYENIIDDTYIEKIVHAAILGSRYSNCFEDVELSIVLTDHEEMRKINREFRGKDKSTNVISMQVEDFSEYQKREYVFLGDLIFSIENIQEEAQKEGKSFINHLSHLIVHGVLHLLGYNHKNDDEQQVMESTEIEILRIMGISSPYKE